MRKWFLGLFAVVLVFFGALVPFMFPRPSPVTRAAFERIEVGMSLAEVEAILGGPPGDYTTRPSRFILIVDPSYSMINEKVDVLVWRGDEGQAHVFVDARGIVREKEFTEQVTGPAGPLETLQWRFGRWWERATGSLP
jgi:hypothetical protein